MTVVMRNTDTGETKLLATDSNSLEYQELVLQRRTRDGRPLWEETGIHDYSALKERLAQGNLRPEDIGDAGQPFNVITGAPAPIDYTPSGQIDRLQPTPTEIASNAGRAALGDDEEFVPTIMQEDGTMATTSNTSLKLPVVESTPPLDSADVLTSPPDFDEMDDEVDDLDHSDDGTDDEEEPDVSEDDQRVKSMVEANDLPGLQSMASSRGLPTSGTKVELAQRVVEHDQTAGSGS